MQFCAAAASVAKLILYLHVIYITLLYSQDSYNLITQRILGFCFQVVKENLEVS